MLSWVKMFFKICTYGKEDTWNRDRTAATYSVYGDSQSETPLDFSSHAHQPLPPYSRFGTLLSLCHPLTRFFCIFVINFTMGNFVIYQLPTHIGFKNIFNFYGIYLFQKCSLYSRRDSNYKIIVLGVHINETCFKTGRVSTRDFTVFRSIKNAFVFLTGLKWMNCM